MSDKLALNLKLRQCNITNLIIPGPGLESNNAVTDPFKLMVRQFLKLPFTQKFKILLNSVLSSVLSQGCCNSKIIFQYKVKKKNVFIKLLS